MEKIGIVIDSTTHTSDALKSYDFIKTVDLKVDVEQKEYRESELSQEQMLQFIEEHKKMKTSQPAPSDFLDAYNAFFEAGYTHVLVVVLSDKISGTFQSAMLAKQLFESDMEVSIHSPEAASFGIANGMRILVEDVKDGKSFDDVLKRYYTLFKNPHISFTLENLKHLFVGGRLNRVQALIGTVLRIKPIVEMVDGQLKMVKKERTNAACLKFFMSKIESYFNQYNHVYVDVIHLGMRKWADKLIADIKEQFPQIDIHLTERVSPVFYVHLGNQGFGISIIGTND